MLESSQRIGRYFQWSLIGPASIVLAVGGLGSPVRKEFDMAIMRNDHHPLIQTGRVMAMLERITLLDTPM
jgi:hypothetical protein